MSTVTENFKKFSETGNIHMPGQDRKLFCGLTTLSLKEARKHQHSDLSLLLLSWGCYILGQCVLVGSEVNQRFVLPQQKGRKTVGDGEVDPL